MLNPWANPAVLHVQNPRSLACRSRRWLDVQTYGQNFPTESFIAHIADLSALIGIKLSRKARQEAGRSVGAGVGMMWSGDACVAPVGGEGPHGTRTRATQATQPLLHPARLLPKEPHSILIPPLTGRYAPVMKPLSSLAKNAIALAISSG